MDLSFGDKNKFSYIANHSQNELLEEFVCQEYEEFQERLEKESRDYYDAYMDDSVSDIELTFRHDKLFFTNDEVKQKCKNGLLGRILKDSFFEQSFELRNGFDTDGMNVRVFFKFDDLTDVGLILLSDDLLEMSELTTINHVYYFIYLEHYDSNFVNIKNTTYTLTLESSNCTDPDDRVTCIADSNDSLLNALHYHYRGIIFPKFCDSLYKKCIYFIYHQEPFMDGLDFPFIEFINDYKANLFRIEEFRNLKELVDY